MGSILGSPFFGKLPNSAVYCITDIPSDISPKHELDGLKSTEPVGVRVACIMHTANS